MGHVFKGFDERHKEADLVHAKKLFGDDFKLNDPVSALQCAQLGLNDLVEKSEFKRANQYMKDVERTTGEGSIILTNEYVEEVVKPWYLENFGKEPEGQDGNGKGGKNGNPAPQGAGGNSGEGETDPDADGETDQEGEGNGNPKYDDKHEDAKDWKGKEPTDKQKEYIKKYGPQDEPVPKTRGGAYDLVSDLMNNQPTKTDKKEPEEVPDPTTDELKKVIRETKSRRKGINVGENMQGKETNFDVKKGIEEAKKDGEKMIDTIEEALADVARGQPNENKRQIMFKKGELEALVGGVNVVKNLPVIEQPQVDKHTVNKLKSIFKRLKSKPKTETSDSGQDIDVELFIKDEIEGGTDFLMDDVEQQGFAVVIGIDESGSMGGQPIQIARNLAGTLYKAFENMPNVEIHVVGWQSAGSHCDVHIIKRYQDVGTLYAGGGTPFRQATLYLGEYMRRLPQKKKLMFQITDGGVSYDKQTMDYLSQLRKQGGNVVTGMCISYYQGGDPSMRDLFGKDNYLSFDSMASVNKVLIEDITKTFVRYMRG
jgi:hypothetical protein